jgi:hypothetical protein
MLVGAQSSSRMQTIEYLRTLLSIRERCGRVHDLAKQGKLQYFEYHPEKEEDVVNYCIRIIQVCQHIPHCLLISLMRPTSVISGVISQL